jgi:hypothetical protein
MEDTVGPLEENIFESVSVTGEVKKGEVVSVLNLMMHHSMKMYGGVEI